MTMKYSVLIPSIAPSVRVSVRRLCVCPRTALMLCGLLWCVCCRVRTSSVSLSMTRARTRSAVFRSDSTCNWCVLRSSLVFYSSATLTLTSKFSRAQAHPQKNPFATERNPNSSRACFYAGRIPSTCVCWRSLVSMRAVEMMLSFM